MDSDHYVKNEGNISKLASVNESQESSNLEKNSKPTRYSYSTQSRLREEGKMKKISKQMNSKVDSIIQKAQYDVNSQSIDKNLYRRGIAEILLGLDNINQNLNSNKQEWRAINKAATPLSNMGVDGQMIQNPAEYNFAEMREKVPNLSLNTINLKKYQNQGVIKINNNLNESDLKVTEDISSRIDFQISKNLLESTEMKEAGLSKEKPEVSNISPYQAFKNKGKFRYNPNQPNLEESSVSNFMDTLKSKKKNEEAMTATIKSVGKSDADRKINTKAPIKRINEKELNEDEKPSKKYMDEILLKESLIKKKIEKEGNSPQIDKKSNKSNDNPNKIREMIKSESQKLNIVNIEDNQPNEDDVINIEGTYNYFHPLGHSNSQQQLDSKLNRNLSGILIKEKEKRKSNYEERKNDEIRNLRIYEKDGYFSSKTYNKKSPKKMELKGTESRGGIIDLSAPQIDLKTKSKSFLDRKENKDSLKPSIATYSYEYHNSIYKKNREIDPKDIKKYSDPDLTVNISKIQRWWKKKIISLMIRAAIQIQKVFRAYLVRNRLDEYSLIFNEIAGKFIIVENLMRKKYLSHAWENLQDYEKPSIVICKNQVDYFKLGFKRRVVDSKFENFTKSEKLDHSNNIKLIQENWRLLKDYKLFKLMRGNSYKQISKVDDIKQREEIPFEKIFKKELVISGIFIEKKIHFRFVIENEEEIQIASNEDSSIPKIDGKEKVDEPKEPQVFNDEKSLKKEHVISSLYMHKTIYSKFLDDKIKKVQKAYSDHKRLSNKIHQKEEIKQVEEIIPTKRILKKESVITSVYLLKIIRTKIADSQVKKIQRASSNHFKSLQNFKLEEKKKIVNDIFEKEIPTQKVMRKDNIIPSIFISKKILTMFSDEIKEEETSVMKILKKEIAPSPIYIQKMIRSKYFYSKVRKIQQNYLIHLKTSKAPVEETLKVEEIKSQEISEFEKVLNNQELKQEIEITKIQQIENLITIKKYLPSAVYLEKKIISKFIHTKALKIQKSYLLHRSTLNKNKTHLNRVLEIQQEDDEPTKKYIKKFNTISALYLEKTIKNNQTKFIEERLKKIQKACSIYSSFPNDEKRYDKVISTTKSQENIQNLIVHSKGKNKIDSPISIFNINKSSHTANYSKKSKFLYHIYAVNKIIRYFRKFLYLRHLDRKDKILSLPNKFYSSSNCFITKEQKFELLHEKILEIQEDSEPRIPKFTIRTENLQQTENIKTNPKLKIFANFTKEAKSSITVRQVRKLQNKFRYSHHSQAGAVSRPVANPFKITKKIVSFESLLKLIILQKRFKKLTLKNKEKMLTKPNTSSDNMTKEHIKVLKLEETQKISSMILTKNMRHEVSKNLSEKVSKIQKLYRTFLNKRQIKPKPKPKIISEENPKNQNITSSSTSIRRSKFIYSVLFTKQINKKANIIKSKIVLIQRHIKNFLKKQNQKVVEHANFIKKSNKLELFTKNVKIFNTEIKIGKIQKSIKRYISNNFARQKPQLSSHNFSKKIISYEDFISLLKIQKVIRGFLVRIKPIKRILKENDDTKEQLQKENNENIVENEIQTVKNIPECKITKLPLKPSAISINKKQIPKPTKKIEKIVRFMRNKVKMLTYNFHLSKIRTQRLPVKLSKPIFTSICEFTKEHKFISSFVTNKTNLINNQVKTHLKTKYVSEKPVRTIRKNVDRNKVIFSKENQEIFGVKRILFLNKVVKKYIQRGKQISKIEDNYKNESLGSLKKIKNFVIPKFSLKSSFAKVYKKLIPIRKIVFLQNMLKTYLQKKLISMIPVNRVIFRKKILKNNAFVSKITKSDYIKKIIDRVKVLLRRRMVLRRLRESIVLKKRIVSPLNLYKSRKAVPQEKLGFVQKILKRFLKKRKNSIKPRSKSINFANVFYSKEILNEFTYRNIILIQKSVKKNIELQRKQRAASESAAIPLRTIRKQVLFGSVRFSKDVNSNFALLQLNLIYKKFKKFKKNSHIIQIKLENSNSFFTKEINDNYYPQKLMTLQSNIKRFLRFRKLFSLYKSCVDIVDPKRIRAEQYPEEFFDLLRTKIVNSVRRDLARDLNEFYIRSQLKLMARNVIKEIFTKPLFTLQKFKQLRKRVSSINLIYTVKQNLIKHIQEVFFRKFSKNFSRGSYRFQVNKLADNSGNIHKQNHFYKTIRRFKKLLNSQDDDRSDIKNKDIVFRHLESIFPKKYAKNYYSYKWWNPEEKLRDEETLREAYIFYDKGEPKLLRFMEFMAKKEKKLKNLRNFFIARLNKIKILYNSNIFALANMADQLYVDLNSKYLCHTCYCKEGEENEKFDDQYYCNCECHTEIREQERSLIESILESARESEEVNLRDSINMSICDDLSKSKMDYDEDMEEDQSIHVRLKLMKKEKKESESIISNRDEFMSRISSRPSKRSKIDNLFKKVTEKSMIKTQDDRESVISPDHQGEYSRRSVVDEECKKSLFRELSKKSIMDLSSRKSINSFQSIDIDPKKKISDEDKRRTEDDDVLMKKYDDEFKKRLLVDELKKKKFEELSYNSNKDTKKLIPIRYDTGTKANIVPTFTSNKNKIPSIFTQNISTISPIKKNVSKLENKLVLRQEESVDDIIMTHKI